MTDNKAFEEIPCEYCGKYYGHSDNCELLVANSGLAQQMAEVEYIHGLQQKIQNLQEQLAGQKELIELLENYIEWNDVYRDELKTQAKQIKDKLNKGE